MDVDALMEEVRAEVAKQRVTGQSSQHPTASVAPSEPVLSTEEIAARVRAEIVRRRAGEAPDRSSEAAVAPVLPKKHGPLPRWQPAAPRLPDKPQYRLGELLCFDDADFVDIAYEKLLKRRADEEGKSRYLDALRSGVISKVEMLGLIRFSEEGRRNSVHVDGLLLPYKLHQWRHRRIVGWFLGAGMAIARLPRLAMRLQGMEASAAREAQEMGSLFNRMERLLDEQLLILERDAREMMAHARAQSWTLERRAALGYATTGTVSRCVCGVDRLMEFSGAKAVFRGNVIQQAFLDIHTARAHVANNPYPYGRNLGAVRFGFENESFDI